MPTHLDIHQSTHGKMLVSPPRLNLRRTASYTGTDPFNKLPLSATSSSFNLNYLLFSPPPSPALPSLVPRPRKSPTTPRPSRVFRLITWLACLVVLLYVARAVFRRDGEVPVAAWALNRPEEYEMVSQYELPDFPTPIAVTDRRGRSKWTVSIPATYNFPLTVEEYQDICAKCHEVAVHVRELHGKSYPSHRDQLDYYYEDPYFLDVREAEERGLFPGIEGQDVKLSARTHPLIGDHSADSVERETCKSSLTFVLESPDAGLGTTLMMLWMAYGLAQKEGRAFFIDDTRWAYGKYTDIFQAPSPPGCSPPPQHQMLPCPHHARHLVVSVATARETFGDNFAAQYERPSRDNVDRERPLFDIARIGYQALFRLNDADQAYVDRRVQDLRMKAKVPSGSQTDGTIIGVHVRHGDRHPYEYQYSSSYMPLNLYIEKAREILDDRYNASLSGGKEDITARQASFMMIASDDSDVYETEEFTAAPRAQERIKLASKAAINQANPDKSVMRKFVDDNFGWEGGFFASMFWSLGRSTANNADGADSVDKTKPSEEALRLRGLIGRAYMMDLAVLGQGSDAVICTVSAMGCRLIAVIMGWKSAMEDGNWVNLDGDYHWVGLTL